MEKINHTESCPRLISVLIKDYSVNSNKGKLCLLATIWQGHKEWSEALHHQTVRCHHNKSHLLN